MVEVGTNAIIRVPGKAGGEGGLGCKFEFEGDNSSKCCFSNPQRSRSLCGQQTWDEDCRRNYFVDEDFQECVLTLKDFQFSDSGSYKAIFPGQPKSTSVVIVNGFERPSPNRSWYSSLVALLLVMTIFAPAAGLLLYLHVWTPHQHEKILGSLEKKDYVLFSKLTERQNILKVQDHNMNGIFHVAAKSDWDEDKTKILVDHLRLKRLLPQSNDPENPTSMTTTRRDIFSIPQEKFKSYDLDSRNAKGETPLIVAAVHNQVDVVETLLDKDVKVDTEDKEGHNAIFHAIVRGFRPIVKLLIRSDRNWERQDMELVFLAAAHNEEEILDLLLKEGANRAGTWKLKDGRTCLLRAVQERNVDAVKLVKHRMEKDNESHVRDRAEALKAAQEMITTGGDWARDGKEMEKIDDIITTLTPKTHLQRVEKGLENIVVNDSAKTTFKKMGKTIMKII